MEEKNKHLKQLNELKYENLEKVSAGVDNKKQIGSSYYKCNNCNCKLRAQEPFDNEKICPECFSKMSLVNERKFKCIPIGLALS